MKMEDACLTYDLNCWALEMKQTFVPLELLRREGGSQRLLVKELCANKLLCVSSSQRSFHQFTLKQILIACFVLKVFLS